MNARCRNLVSRLLRKNTSRAQIAGFTLANFIGIAIVVGALQFYQDIRSIWEGDDSFIRQDYMVVNRRVSGMEAAVEGFSGSELEELRRQPWVRRAAPFTAARYAVDASVGAAGRSMSTRMFFESIPDSYIDVASSQWGYREGDGEVPIILSKDYLTLYNFGFASSAGLPRLSEAMMGSLPLMLTLRSDDGKRTVAIRGRVAGFSNRINTILVPEEFMRLSNAALSHGGAQAPSRIIIDVSRPGDPAINRYLEAHNLETAGDKSNSRAAFFMRVASGVVTGIGGLITLLSLFIMMLSVQLLMQKNRDKLHTLLMLGFTIRAAGAPYRRIVVASASASLMLALGAMYLFRLGWIRPVAEMGGGHGLWWLAPLCGVVITLLVVLFNLIAVRRRVASSWR